jgi:predicted RNA-binding protein associated with RNAse of E/G family
VTRPVRASALAYDGHVKYSWPLTWTGRELAFVDLELDVIVRPDRTVEVTDEDELAAAVDRYWIPPDVVDRAWETVEEVRRAVAAGAPPFS